ncbi:MAG: hypothetical protein ABI378_07285 [Chitinophagaceae bacterium]
MMKSIKELNERKVPIVIIDKALNKLDKVVLFPKKVAKAKETLGKIGLPSKKQTQ